MRRLFFVIVIIVMGSLPCVAGPREDLLAAYSREDYATAWKLAMPLAQSGDEIAEYLTGKLLHDGNGIAQDNKEAVVWLRKAAEKGNSAAEEELGSTLAFDLKQKDEAKVWLQKAVDAKFPPAFRDLGWLIESSDSATALTDAAELYRRGTELNDRDSQALYAKALLNGRGIAKDEKAAAQLYCQLRSDDSQRLCGMLIMAKMVPDVKPVEGFNLLKKLADHGDDGSQVEVSNAYLRGDVVPKNIDEGVHQLKLAVEKENAAAYFNMGWLSSQGIGMPKDRQAAFDWYKKASDKKYPYASRRVADFLWVGIAGKPDQAEAIRYYKLSAENGDDEADYVLAIALNTANDPLKDELAASDIFCKLEKADAIYECARMMLDEKTRKNDPDRAVVLLRKASDKGQKDAEAHLGYFYMNGINLVQDFKEGLRLTHLAADQGSLRAFNNLGFFYENGLGVHIDKKQAMEWFKKVADAGNVDGLVSLGYLLAQKSSEVYDAVGATQYFKKAADLGNDDAKLQYAYYLQEGKVIAKDELAASDLFCALTTSIGRYECTLMNIAGTSRKANKQHGFDELGKLADEGFANAQAELGYHFFNGIDLKKNVAEGIRLTELAAARKDQAGVANIGYFYQVGLGSYHKDLAKAAEKYQEAVDLGSNYAMVELGKLMETKALGPPNLERALSLYQQAEDAGNADAAKLAASLIKRGVSAGFTALPKK